MDWLEIINRYYPKFYKNEDVRVFVEKEKITETQYFEITGEPY